MTKTVPIHRSFASATVSPEAQCGFASLRNFSWTAPLLTPWLAGCGPVNTALIQDLAPMWLVLSLIGVGLVGGVGIWWGYGNSLADWDHESSLSAPDSSRQRNILIGSVMVIVLAFALYNWFSDIGIPPAQQWENIVGCLVGTTVGGFAGYLGGRRLAAASYRKSIEAGAQGHQGRLPGEER